MITVPKVYVTDPYPDRGLVVHGSVAHEGPEDHEAASQCHKELALAVWKVGRNRSTTARNTPFACQA